MKYLFYGEMTGNCGPSNVNRGMVNNLTESFLHSVSTNKYFEMVDLFLKLLRCRVVIVSGVSRKGKLLFSFAKRLRLAKVYIMHGCAAYEMNINKMQRDEKGLAQEQYLLEHADLILPVSQRFQHWVNERYPEYAHKTSYLNNGFDAEQMKGVHPAQKGAGLVAATGADRIIKNNEVLAKAIEKMGGAARCKVYGHIYHSVPTNYAYTEYVGVIPHGDYLQALSETDLFVVNSLLESFSLSAIEALLCGSSVLISEAAGVVDILPLEDHDIIHDPSNEDEIREKIQYLLEHPNNRRILAQMDLSQHTYRKSVIRLEEICLELLRKNLICGVRCHG